MPAVSRTKGLSNSKEELAGCGPAHLPPEVGGRGKGKGANSAPETVSPTKLQTASQLLTKDFLRFWMVDIRQEGRGYRPAPENRHKAHAPDWRTWKLRLGLWRG